ncbi:hypothetical protein TI05_19025 [Achromatium sp. WMS3]|nr:hypothetical protein TI05_19025 [Achromatium sp. WMS3]
METETTIFVNVNILDKEYRIACQEHERELLQNSAYYLDKRMREVRQSGRIIGADRIAVMAALNISHEFLEQRNAQVLREQVLQERINVLQAKIERILGATTN